MSDTNWTPEDRAELTDLGATEYGALVRDAKRYRLLRGPLARGGAVIEVTRWADGFGEVLTGVALDKALDAMGAAK